MPRLFLAALAALLLLALPATASSSSGTRVRGAVTAKDVGQSLVTVTSTRRVNVLRVPEVALPRIQVGKRVELRGTTLRSRGRGPTRVLARGVTLVSSQPMAQANDAQANDDEIENELEVKGTLTSLSPVTVSANGASFTCAVPAGVSLSGFAVGDVVEMKCDLVGGIQTLRKLELQDDEDDDSSGPGNAHDDDDDDSSGPGSGGDDDGGSGHHGGDDGGDD